MKLSVSVPDDLWDAVAKEGDSPSEVVQEALRDIARRRNPPEPFGRAPTAQVKERNEDTLREAVNHVRRLREVAREAGYIAGARLVIEGYFDDYPWFELVAQRDSVRDTAAYLNEQGTPRIAERIRELAGGDFWRAQEDPDQGAWVSCDFIEGVSAAIHDLWEEAANEAGATE
jgi:hypothetical protein